MLSQYPGLLDFIHICPHGLVTVERSNPQVELKVYPTFCLLTASSKVSPIMLLAPLERLRLSTIFNLSLLPSEAPTPVGELLWLYAYARAQQRNSTLHYSNLTPNKSPVGWDAAFVSCRTASTLSLLQQIHAFLLTQFDFPSSYLLKPMLPSYWSEVWLSAQRLDDPSEFLQISGEITNSVFSPEYGNFRKLATPKDRLVIQTAYSVKEGVLASYPFGEIQTLQDMKGYVSYLQDHPIISRDHDTSQPIGLSCEHHIAPKDTLGSGELHIKVYITNRTFSKESHNYRGFSLGAFREEDGNAGK